MQDQHVAFDPITIDRVTPWQTRVFVLYLMAVCGIWLVRSAKLFWLLRIFPASLRKLQPKSSEKNDQAEFLARSALAKKLPELISTSGAPLLRRAGSIFGLMWDECWIKVSSMNRLAGLTFLSSLLFGAWLTATDFTEFSYSKMIGPGGLAGALSELFSQLTLGMGVCVVLYVTGSFLEKELLKRKSLWNYLCAKLEVENKTEA